MKNGNASDANVYRGLSCFDCWSSLLQQSRCEIIVSMVDHAHHQKIKDRSVPRWGLRLCWWQQVLTFVWWGLCSITWPDVGAQAHCSGCKRVVHSISLLLFSMSKQLFHLPGWWIPILTNLVFRLGQLHQHAQSACQNP